jgi:hypothetical protein
MEGVSKIPMEFQKFPSFDITLGSISREKRLGINYFAKNG